MNSTIRLLAFSCILFACSLLAQSQTVTPESIIGRWDLTMEVEPWRIETLADLRIEKSATASLVMLGPTKGEDGLFTGRLAGNQLLLSGQYAGTPVELTLNLNGDRVIGNMVGDNWRAGIQGQRVPVATPEVSVKQYKKLFDAVWNGVKLHFIDPGLNGVNLEAVRRQYLPQVQAARNEGELAVAVRRSLRELHASNTEFFLSTGRPARWLNTERVSWKKIAPDVGYLALLDFTAEDLQGFDTQLDRAMDEAVKHHKLVVDLRGNRGENLEAALAALNFLLPEGRSIAYFATRVGLARLGVSSIDQVNPASLPASFVDNQIVLSKFRGAGMFLAGGKYKRPYLGRIALLIDESCQGSCELFAAAIKEAGVATLIGRHTPGAMLFATPVTFTFMTSLNGMPISKSNVKGWRMGLPSIDIRTAAGKKIEGKGVEPDLVVERAGSGDVILENAMQWLEGKRRQK